MMRPHCDRCDTLCGDYKTWIDDSVVGEKAHAWHIFITEGGSTYADEKFFCRACMIVILATYVQALKSRNDE